MSDLAPYNLLPRRLFLGFFAAAALGAVVCVLAPAAHADESDRTQSTTSLRTSDGAQEFVISASRLPTDPARIGSSITVIDRREIEERQVSHVADILRDQVGVDIVQSGGSGGNAVAFIRGGNSEHTLVLIDGIEINNPGSPNRAYNFADLALDNVERIEILRGPQSTLYGSDAIGGVINIITRRGQGAPRFTISAEGGSYETFIERISGSGGDERANFSLGMSREDSGGISAARSGAGNSEQDAYHNTSASMRIGLTPHEQLEANLYLRYVNAHTDLDDTGGDLGDDPNRLLRDEQFFTRAEVLTKFFGGTLAQTYGVSYSDQRIDDDDNPDSAHPVDFLRSNFEGNLLKFDLQNNIIADQYQTFVLGVETEQEEADSLFNSESDFGPFVEDPDVQDARSNGYYLQDQIAIGERFFTTAGLRVDDHSRAGSETTWRVAPAVLFQEIGVRLKGAYGTGFKAPSLVQLFSSFGNPDLEPEKSRGWEVGAEKTFCDERAVLGLTYFHNRYENLITFNSGTFRSENIGDAASKGFEVSASFRPIERITLATGYTYTDTEDRDTGLALLRRARNKVATSISYSPVEGTALRLDHQYVGPRADTDFAAFPAERVTLSGYSVVNITATRRLTERVELFARVENLFDREYEDVLGFGRRGLAAYTGIKVNLDG